MVAAELVRGGVPPLSIRVAARIRSLRLFDGLCSSRAGRHPQLNHFSSFTAAAPSGRVVAAELVRVAARMRSLHYAMEKLFSRAGRHRPLNKFLSFTAAAPSA